MYDNPPPVGLDQFENGRPSTNKHHPHHGWDLIYYDTPCEIFLQDDLTYRDGKIVELEKYKKYYGDDIADVTFYVWHKTIGEIYPELNFVYYPLFHWKHIIDAEKNNIPEKFQFVNDKPIPFLSLNRNIRKHRDYIVPKLLNRGGIVSYKSKGIEINEIDDWSMEEYYSHRSDTIIVNTANLLHLKPVYEKCQFSVVTETRFSLPFDFITEKTTQCFLALHPALYVSNKHHVKMLRDMGFDVFDDIFNHSYDNIGDEYRIDCLLMTNKDVLNNGISNYNTLEERLVKNRNHYLRNFV